MPTSFKAGCCAHCKKAIRNPQKYEPIFYVSDGPVYLHPRCVAAFNYGCEPPANEAADPDPESDQL